MLTSPTFCHICMTLHFCLFWPTPYEWLTGNKLALKNIGTQNLFSKQFGPCYLQSSRILSSTVTQKSKHHSKNIFVKNFQSQTIIVKWGLLWSYYRLTIFFLSMKSTKNYITGIPVLNWHLFKFCYALRRQSLSIKFKEQKKSNKFCLEKLTK